MSSKTRVAEIADAVVAELNDPARNWVQSFTADRIWWEREAAADLKQLQVRVSILASVQQLHNRAYRGNVHEIAIAFRKNVTARNTEAIDALSAFVEQVADYFGADTVNGGAKKIAGTEAIVTGVQFDPICSPEELDTNQRFFSVLTLTILQLTAIVAES